MTQRSRRGFLADVGRGALVATVGGRLALDMGFADTLAEEAKADRLTFGALEPLVGLMQETPVDRLMSVLIGKLNEGADLGDLVSAAAFANARTFGGEDYIGFHTMMALAPAYHMSKELPENRRVLPVLKVLYRNTNRIQEFGGPSKEVLHTVQPGPLSAGRPNGETLREAVRAKDMEAAERTFAALSRGNPEDAFNDVLYAVQDNTEVHRTVLPYRSWDLLGLIGREHAATLLRQSVRYCVKSERDWRHTAEMDRPRTVLPRVMDEYKLAGRSEFGKREADDTWIDKTSKAIFEASPEHAAEIAGAALAEGFAPASIGEAIALAANQLVLRDAGRVGSQIQAGKPLGSVHGDSIGVHACDSANAWRNMAKVSNARNTAACLILGAYQVALDRLNRGGEFLNATPHPRPEDLEKIGANGPEGLLKALDESIRANDQFRACAVVHKIGETGGDSAKVFPLLLGYAVSEDGALHAEKYYRTVREEFATTRPAFRWRQLVALARVTASEYGKTAAGYSEACSLLKV